MVIILLGPPGVGKGTQGALLTESFGWERIATGDLLRGARRDGTELGRQAQSYMDAGNLVPDELIVALVREHLKKLPPERGVVFDGFPRTLAQAEALDQVLPEVGRKVDAVLLLEAPADVLVKRLSGRRSCPQCERIYNIHFDPPVTEGTCDECGARLIQRKDDLPDTVRHRLSVYRDQTRPLVTHYEEGSTPVLRIEGDRKLEHVTRAIRRSLVKQLGVEA